MASPVPKFPEVIKSLNKLNYTTQTGIHQLRTEIMRVTGAIKPHTITQIVKAMHDLGYIKDSGNGAIFYLYQDEKPYNFPQKKEDDEELDKYEPTE